MPGAETFRGSVDAYDRHVGRYGSQLASALIEFTGLEQGMRTLDVGCGPGALTEVRESHGTFEDSCRERWGLLTAAGTPARRGRVGVKNS